MPTTVTTDAMIPVAHAAIALRMSRERVMRRIQCGAIAGECRNGKWFVSRASIDATLAQTMPEPRPAA